MPTTIIGVDFSGALGDRNTWIAEGSLTDDNALVLNDARRIRRADLSELLLNEIPAPAVTALDFPFGLPRQFAAHIGNQEFTTMDQIWPQVAANTSSQFVAERDAFVQNHGEPKRAGDAEHHSESFSPLHKVQPNMVPMTYEGICMLHRLHQARPDRWRVPPLEPAAPPSRQITLLEVMPGAFLRSINLPYKGYKNGKQRSELRTRILDELAAKSGIALPNLDLVRRACLANDDCLDAVVAAIAAAMWAQNPARFQHPTPDELPDAKLEGWIYSPTHPDNT